MATQTVEFRAASGATLTAKLFAVGSDTVVQTASAVVESGNRKGTYSALFADVPAGEYELIAFSGTIPVCRWFVTLTLTTATFQAYEVRTQSVVARVTANTDQWNGVGVTGMPLPTTSYTAPLSTAQTAAAVWDAALTTYTTAGTFGARVVRSTNSNNEVQITGSSHVAADIHELQAGVITAGDFAADWFTAAGIAADAVTELQAGLATASALATLTGYVDTEVAAIKVVTDKLNTGLVADGAVYQFTANMLELAPAGGGGAGDASQTTLLEVQDTVESIAASLSGVPITASGRIADGGAIVAYCGDDYRIRSGSQLTLTVTDVGGAIYTRLNGIGVGNLSFGASRNGLQPAAISGTIASLSQAGSGASQTLSVVVEIDGAGDYLRPAEDYLWQIESEQTHGSEVDQVVEMEGTLALRRRVV